MRNYPRLGFAIGWLGAVAGFAAIQLDRIFVTPEGIEATAQAQAQSSRLHIYGTIMIVAASLTIGSGLALLVQRLRRSRHS